MEQKPTEVEFMPPQKTWFFTDSTGRIFSANEKEAFNLLTENSRWRRQDIRMLGSSDGTTYYNVIRESKSKAAELQESIRAIKEKRDKYIASHDKLLFEEFVSEDDPRIVRAKELIAKTNEELTPLEDELREVRTNILQKAFDAELEVARGKLVKPRDFTVIGKTDGSPKNERFMQNFIESKSVL